MLERIRSIASPISITICIYFFLKNIYEALNPKNKVLLKVILDSSTLSITLNLRLLRPPRADRTRCRRIESQNGSSRGTGIKRREWKEREEMHWRIYQCLMGIVKTFNRFPLSESVSLQSDRVIHEYKTI